MREVHGGEHQGGKKLHEWLLSTGYYWPSMKRNTVEFVKCCHTCQMHANLIHTHPISLQDMSTPWHFYTWGLNLIGPSIRHQMATFGSCRHRIFYEMGGSYFAQKSDKASYGQFHQKAHPLPFWGSIQDCEQKWNSVHKQRCLRNHRVLQNQASKVDPLLPSREWTNGGNQ